LGVLVHSEDRTPSYDPGRASYIILVVTSISAKNIA